MTWLNNLDDSILEYLNNLKKKDSDFKFKPVESYITNDGKSIDLGFSCYALKIYKLLDEVQNFSDSQINGWSNFINSYQNKDKKFPINSYLDVGYINSTRKNNFYSKSTYPLKFISNITFKTNYKSPGVKLNEYIRAETKQSISTLYEIDKKNQTKYEEFPKSKDSVNTYLNGLNWRYPWSSGAQFSALCTLSKTQLSKSQFDEVMIHLTTFSDKLVNEESGLYFTGKTIPNDYELINGAMKILTGLDWLEAKIHYPEKIIDFCMKSNISNLGCDIVDLVYVLYRCSKETSYRRKDVVNFFDNVLEIIKQHYFEKQGGFSYFLNSNQTNYYDVKFANKKSQPDIHGSLLFLWAIVMIMDLSENVYFKYNLLKP